LREELSHCEKKSCYVCLVRVWVWCVRVVTLDY